jgi:hypothetical protein
VSASSERPILGPSGRRAGLSEERLFRRSCFGCGKQTGVLLAANVRPQARLSLPGSLLALGFAALTLCALSSASTPSTARAQASLAWSDSRPEDLTIKLVTFGPGSDIYNYFGHNGIIVEDSAQHLARLYNFGMFSFGLDMLPNYMKGKLTFWVAETPVRATFAHYIDMNRSVHVQELDLTPARRVELAHSLAVQVLPENREYLYDHYYNNCSTRLRDLVDQATGGQFSKALDHPARMTFREHTRRHAQKDALLDFALVFWMNDSMEKPLKQWNELFLPGELELQVGRMQYTKPNGQRVPLVAASYAVYEARRAPVPERPARTWPFTLLFGCVAGGLLWLTALWMKRTGNVWARTVFGLQHVVWGFLFGVMGTAGFLMWAFTEHLVTYRNENQFLANPLTLLWLPLGIAIIFGSKRALTLARYVFYALAASSLALCVLKLLPNFDQDTSLTMTLLLPLNLGGALAHHALVREPATAPAPLSAERAAGSRA